MLSRWATGIAAGAKTNILIMSGRSWALKALFSFSETTSGRPNLYIYSVWKLPGEVPGGPRDARLALKENVRLRRRCTFSLGNIHIGGEPPSWPGKGGGRGRSF